MLQSAMDMGDRLLWTWHWTYIL